MKDYANYLNSADTDIDIVKATADTLIQAHKSEDGVEIEDAIWVLLGIIDRLESVQENIRMTFNVLRSQKGGTA